MIARWMEITFVLIILYLVVKNAPGFASAVRSISAGYIGAVKALQGN